MQVLPKLRLRPGKSYVSIHYPDDGRRITIDFNHAAYDIRAAVEAALPELSADHNQIGPSRRVVARLKSAPENWIHAKNGEEIRSHGRAGHFFRLAFAGKRETAFAVR